MSENTVSYVWESRLDQKYHCFVTRVAEGKGVLKIVDENNHILYEKEVGLSYGAIFGPDMSDVSDWEKTCINVVDNL